MIPAEVLRQAKALISTPDSWCRREYAMNSSGLSVGAIAKDAVRWCAIGVTLKLTDNLVDYVKVCNFLEDAAFTLFDSSSVTVNDNLGHSAVMEMYERAIALAKEEAKP